VETNLPSSGIFSLFFGENDHYVKNFFRDVIQELKCTPFNSKIRSVFIALTLERLARIMDWRFDMPEDCPGRF